MKKRKIHPLIVDMLAGGGGASTGIHMALGRHPDVAIDYSPEAMAMHLANHPGTRHICDDVWSCPPQRATNGDPVALLWASPECTNHSNAKGGPRNRDVKSREMAWAVAKFAAEVFPTVIILENVVGFLRWGPCDKDGVPIKSEEGRDFRAFKRALSKLGYTVQWRLLRADDYGAATIRERLIIIARLDGRKIIWPKPTHGPGRKYSYSTVGQCIDWDIHCRSIFFRKKQLSQATCLHIAEGIKRHVLNTGQPFVLSYFGRKNKDDFRGFTLDQRLGTQTTSNIHALVVPVLMRLADNTIIGPGKSVHSTQGPLLDNKDFSPVLEHFGTLMVSGEQCALIDIGMRFLTPRELFRVQGFPESYIIGDTPAQGLELTKADQLRMCGNSVCPPLAAALVRANYSKTRPRVTGLPLLGWAV